MRSLVCGASLLVLTLSLPALADCADDVAALEQELATAAAPAAGAEDQAGVASDAAGGQADAGGSEEEVVEEMVEEGVSVEEDGAETKFAAGGHAEPRESWHSADSLEDHPAVVHLANAKQQLEAGDQQGCMDALAEARAALDEEQQAD